MRTRVTDQGVKAQLAGVLRAGRVYRREDLLPFSKAVDRHLRELVADGLLTKLAQGLYYAPRNSNFGALPPADGALIAAFLRDKDFLMFSPSAYNSAGLGTTQLYHRTWVYNHKRHGIFKLGNREFDFRMKPRFPRKLTPEFLFVDALNHLGELAEDQAEVMARAKDRMSSFDQQRLQRALANYGTVATKKRLMAWLHA
ncbi:MAG: hypothetical protein ACYCOR_09715 [Acidobacteriaceae bacterium]